LGVETSWLPTKPLAHFAREQVAFGTLVAHLLQAQGVFDYNHSALGGLFVTPFFYAADFFLILFLIWQIPELDLRYPILQPMKRSCYKYIYLRMHTYIYL
jgi:hypothetical protein